MIICWEHFQNKDKRFIRDPKNFKAGNDIPSSLHDKRAYIEEIKS